METSPVSNTKENDTPKASSRLQEEYIKKQQQLGRTVKVFDYGEVELVDFFGSDLAICEAAWVSTKGAVKDKSPVPQFLDYLLRHKHLSPFEMCEIQLRIKAPLFVVQQLLRHRTGNFNQVSARYTELPDEVYYPKQWRSGNTGHNKQGSGDAIEKAAVAEALYQKLAFDAKVSEHVLRELGVAPELSRMAQLTSQYTEIIFKSDLRNLMHFLTLRTDSHAQEEIRVYANVIEHIATQLWPEAMKAWENHQKYAMTFSQDELAVLSELVSMALNYDTAGSTNPDAQDSALRDVVGRTGLRQTRQAELLEKLNRVLAS